MSYNFLPYDQKQLLLLPPSIAEWVKKESLAQYVSDFVEELDRSRGLDAFYARYRADGWGRASYHPKLMIKVLVYGYALGVRSSRKLAQALEEHVGFRYLAGNQQPDFRTLSDFRKEHIAAMHGLFTQVLQVCARNGMVKLGVVALDGRRTAGNAALERNRSKASLEKLVQEILQEADQLDEAEDRQYGPDQRGDELPEALRTPERRLKAIREALEQIRQPEEEIRREHAEKLDARKAREEKTGKRSKGAPPKLKEDRINRLRANLTDPESRAMKSRKGFVQGYNGQAMVDCSSQVIVAQDLRQEGVDWGLVKPMLECCEVQAGARPKVCLMDGGYWSEANAALADEQTEFYIAVGSSAAFEGRTDKRKRKRAPRKGPEAVKMREKLSTEEGRSLYKQRGSTVEPVFGQQYERGLNRFLLRGLLKAGGEWSLWCMTHNLLKLWRAGVRFQPA